jgi:hypothetical protein
MSSAARLWRGDVALAHAFWQCAIVYGSLLNLLTTIAAFALLSAGAAIPLVVLAHLLPLPYNVLAVVGVWRSAANYRGDALWASLARVAVIIWAGLATIA